MGFRRLVSVVASWVLALSAATAGLRTAHAGQPQLFRLPNGMKVVLHDNPADATVVTLVAYGAGAAREPAGYRGLAHLVEHLAYGGSRHVVGQGMFEHLEAAGAPRWNGVTTDDHAYYYSEVLPGRFALPLWLESERMAFTLERFDEATLATQRERVLKELYQRGRTREHFEHHINQVLYPEGHPYRKSIDEVADVRAIELRDAAWFFQTHYRPDNATLVMTGHFDPARAAEEIRRYFGPIQNPPNELRALARYGRRFAARERLVYEDAQTLVKNRILAIFDAPQASDPSSTAFELLLTRIGSRSAFSLHELLVTNTRVAESVGVWLERRELASHAVIDVRVRANVDPRIAERALETYLVRLSTLDDEAELQALKTELRLSTLEQLEDPLSRAFLHWNTLQATGRPFSLTERLRLVQGSSRADLREAARLYLDRGRRLIATHVPTKRAKCWNGCASHTIEGGP